jgi:hypothetical protein
VPGIRAAGRLFSKAGGAYKERPMARARQFRFALLPLVMAGFSLLVGACLNPISFDEDMLPSLKVEVSGSITTKIDDVAVLWLINRTKQVDVTKFTITRSQLPGESNTEYGYPKEFINKPLRQQSHASYHKPTEIRYTIRVEYRDEANNTGTLSLDNIYFPRALDYKFYLYKDLEGNIRLLDEDQMRTLPANPDDNIEVPPLSGVDAQSFVVINVTDVDVDDMDFVKDSVTYHIAGGPRAKDQRMRYLPTGEYEATASYTKNNVPGVTVPKHIAVTTEGGGMAVRTNFVYFYKTQSGDYSLSQYWPPLSLDHALNGNEPEDALTENQGILKIINQASPGSPHHTIAKVTINGTPYPSANNTGAYITYMAEKIYILGVGMVDVSFASTNSPDSDGMRIPVEIRSKKTTTLIYTQDHARGGVLPRDDGFGAGLIKITNLSGTGIVYGVTIYDRGDLTNSVDYGTDSFNPPREINSGNVGLLPVVGTSDFRLNPGASQLIQVALETSGGLVYVERIASLNGAIITITINSADLDNARRAGSKVTVVNGTTFPTAIQTLEVFEVIPGTTTPKSNVSASYSLSTTTQSGVPSSSSSNPVYVLSTAGLPIVDAAQEFRARLLVTGNGHSATVLKSFSPSSSLYSLNPETSLRTITLTDTDLLPYPDLKENFVPVSGINFSASPLTVYSFTRSNPDGSNPQWVHQGQLNLSDYAVVTASGGTPSKTSPIEWTLSDSGGGRAAIVDGVLKAVGFPPAGQTTVIVKVKATIRNAKGTVTAKTDFVSGDLPVNLEYVNTISTLKVTDFSLSGTVSLQENQQYDLKNLVPQSGILPSGANIDGLLITAADLEWEISGPPSNASLNGSLLTMGTGDITVKATMPAAKTQSGVKIEKTIVITFTFTGPPFVAIGGLSLSTPSLKLPFYTKTVGSTRTFFPTNASLVLSAGNLIFTPPDATIQSPAYWDKAVGGSANLSLVSVAPLQGNQYEFKVTGVDSSVVNGATINVRVTIPNAISNGTGDMIQIFTVTLEEHNSRLLGPSGDLTVGDRTIEIGGTLNLNDLATLPSNAYVRTPSEDRPITVSDLVWTIVNGSDKATLSGTTITGAMSGNVTVRATLPSAKNGGAGDVWDEGTITVMPPEKLTLRLIHLNTDDTISQIALIPITPPFTLTPDIKSTGHTGKKWPTVADTALSPRKTAWAKQFKDYTIIYKTVGIRGTWKDIEIERPPVGYTGYYLFFIEGDSNVRGYCKPGSLDPKSMYCFYFYLDYESLSPMWMVGKSHMSSTASGASLVVPIGYQSYQNTASIMKSVGPGNPVQHNLPGTGW